MTLHLFIAVWLRTGLSIFVFMNLWFVVSRIRRRNDVADIAWGLGFLFVALVNFREASAFSISTIVLVGLWALRLATRIALRAQKTGEDPRYVEFRKSWGAHPALGAYFQVFLLQGLFMWVVTMPIVAVMNGYRYEMGFVHYVGLAIFIFGMAFEAVADLQLYRFKQNPAHKGQIMRSGLWAYSRHPNYFGEITLWWGFYLFAISSGVWWLTICGPIMITVLITKVTGLPLVEKQLLTRPGAAEYVRQTSILIPMKKKT